MKKKIGIGAGIIVLIGLCVGGYIYYSLSSRIVRLTPEYTKKMMQEVAKQNEAAINKPQPRVRTIQPANPLKNVYFGDTHVHSALSFDSYLFGNRLGLEDAYRFAQGEQLQLKTGEILKKSVPLDFIAVTDHAESFGLFETCSDPNANDVQREFCDKFDNPNLTFFMMLKNSGAVRPPKRPPELRQSGFGKSWFPERHPRPHSYGTLQRDRELLARAYFQHIGSCKPTLGPTVEQGATKCIGDLVDMDTDRC